MFLLLALPNGTPEQLQKLQTKTVHAQILWIGENIKKRAIALNLSFLQSSEFAASILNLSFLQSTGRRRIFLSEEQICNLLWHS